MLWNLLTETRTTRCEPDQTLDDMLCIFVAIIPVETWKCKCFPIELGFSYIHVMCEESPSQPDSLSLK